jgi:hypothetical protein
MFAWCSSGHFGHRALGQTRPIGGARVQRRHAASLPSKERFQLGDGRAVLGRAGSTDLPATMCRLRHAGRAARVAEHVTERLFRQRLAALAADERKLAARSGRQRRGKRGQDRKRYRDLTLALLRPDRRHAVAHMLAPELDGIAAAEAGE